LQIVFYLKSASGGLGRFAAKTFLEQTQVCFDQFLKAVLIANKIIFLLPQMHGLWISFSLFLT